VVALRGDRNDSSIPGKRATFEMQASAIDVIGWVDDPDTYPIQPKPHTLEFLREVAHLRPRTNVIGAATRVRHTLAQAVHQFFDDNGFLWVNTPIITASDAEGAGALFRVSTLDLANLPRTTQGGVDFMQDFFGRETFLTVSGQLNVEAYCLALTKVYTFGPTFRAENSNTRWHLAEFWMIEPEIAFADLSDDATLAERLLKFTLETLLNKSHEDLEFFDERIEKGLGGPQASLFRPDDEVFYAGSVVRSGTNAEFHLVDERIVGRKPRSLGFAEAAALPLTSITAWEALFDRMDIRKPVAGAAPAVLIIGGAGGVSSMAIQLVRTLTDLIVVATASRPETMSWVKDFGAHHVIDHGKPIARRSQRWASALRVLCSPPPTRQTVSRRSSS
jgi:hypothetical protein